MKSPFPGMDPYLEPAWSDVHAKLVAFIAEPIAAQLPRGLRVITEEDVSVASDDPADPQWVRPDATVTGHDRARGGVAVMSTPPGRSVRVHLNRSPRAEKRVVIVDAQAAGRVVTAIEVLSPSNKAPGDRNQKYRRKLEMYRHGGVSVLEIDLLRYPSRDRLEVSQGHLPEDARSAYMAGVRRGWDSDDWDMHPISLRERIPVLPVPLRQTDADVMLDLQPLIDRIYQLGSYGDVINYGVPCEPPLDEDDARWAEELVQSRLA